MPKNRIFGEEIYCSCSIPWWFVGAGEKHNIGGNGPVTWIEWRNWLLLEDARFWPQRVLSSKARRWQWPGQGLHSSQKTKWWRALYVNQKNPENMVSMWKLSKNGQNVVNEQSLVCQSEESWKHGIDVKIVKEWPKRCQWTTVAKARPSSPCSSPWTKWWRALLSFNQTKPETMMAMYWIVLYGIVLYCIVLYCIVLMSYINKYIFQTVISHWFMVAQSNVFC